MVADDSEAHPMQKTHLLALLSCTAVACQGLEPLPKDRDTGASTDTAASDVVQLGDLRIDPGTVRFGVVGLGEEAVKSVVMTNTGSDALIVRQVSLNGDSQFGVSTTSTLPLQLEGGSDVVVDVAFTPDAAESYSAALDLDVNSLDEPYLIEVTGSGEGAVVDTSDTDTDTDPPAGELVANPSSVDFGEVPTNQAGSYDVTLTNNHSDNILIQQITGVPSEFGYQLGGEITLPQVVAPDESRTLTLTFDPAAETAYSGTVDLSLDVSGTSKSMSIAVQGVGVEPPCDICAPIVNVSPNPVSITSPLGCEADETISITNVGDQDLVVTDITVTNGSWLCGTFTISSGSTSTTLSPGSSSTVTVEFSATAPLCSESSNLSRDINVLHIQNNSGQPDYQVEMQGFATCPG
jgi:hypothetical protein